MWQPLHRLGTIVGLILAAIAASNYSVQEMAIPASSTMIGGYERVLTALVLGGVGAALYGILWSTANRLFKWNFGEGFGPGLPRGWEAVVLSLCTTIPLAVLPPLFELVTRKQIVWPGHYVASIAMIFAAAIGHIMLYGTKRPRIPGLRDRVFPHDNPLDAWAAIRMEVIYAVVHFLSTVFVYQLVVGSKQVDMTKIFSALEKAGLSGSLFFIGACSYIAIRYPASLAPIAIKRQDGTTVMDDRWMAARGIVNGAILMEAFFIGILL